MKGKKITGMKWLTKQVKKLEVTTNEFKEITEKIIKIDSDIYNEFRAWTPLKLVLLNYVLDVCSLIINSNIKKKIIFRESYYVDLFAGSGINKIKKDFLIGSPLITSLKYQDRFNKLFLCEKDPNRFRALNRRIAFLSKDNICLSNLDCNDFLEKVLPDINKKGVYSFFFIDPSCMEFSWTSMTKTLELRSDIVFTLMASEILRSIGLCKAKKSEGKYLDIFFGDESWKNIKNYDELIRLYKSNIIKIRPNALIEDIKIKSKKFGFCYSILFITNKTKKNCPWMKAIEKLKEEIESNSDKSVEMALEIIKGRQMILS